MVAGRQKVDFIGTAVADKTFDRGGIGYVDIVTRHSDNMIIILSQKIAQIAPVLTAISDDDRCPVAFFLNCIQGTTTSSLGSGNMSRCPL